MVKFGIGQSVRRVEDQRLLTGQGRFTDDVNLEGQAYVVIVRSPYAHAKILSIDVDEAQGAEGVLTVITGPELIEAGLGEVANVAWAAVRQPDGSQAWKSTRPILALERVRHVGDAVAAVVAETAALARDGAELVFVDYDELPVAVDTEQAASHDSPVVWDELGSNVDYTWEFGELGPVDKALSGAAHVTELKLINNRIVVNAMEPRGAVADYDADADRYLLHAGCQGAHGLRDRLAEIGLKIPKEKLRVISDDVGGGFGMKTFAYPEYLVALYGAKKVGRPVKWTADRSESFLSDSQGRDHVTTAKIGFDEVGKIVGLRVDTIANLGAYQSQFGAFVPCLAPRNMQVGVYQVPTFFNQVKAVFTNTVPVDAYRGAGRPEASYVIERLMEQAARELKLAPEELRRRNFIPADAMPYKNAPSLPFDSGDFDRNLTDALARSDYDGFGTRREAAKARGKVAGIGISYYVERTAAGMNEYAQLEVDPKNGVVNVWTGAQTNGQGHETAWTQFISSRLGLDAEQIKVHLGDSDRLPGGAGTGGSKSIYMATGALGVASDSLIEKGKKIASHELEAAEIDIEYRGSDGLAEFGIVGTDRKISLFDVARIAETQVDVDVFGADGDYNEAGNTYPNGAHICEVEIDPDTGAFEIVRYTVVDDIGHVLNPMIAEGQIQGGIVQGLGQAMGENAVYDEETGQLITGSFQDYWMPRADDMPNFDFTYNEIPTGTNELGVKGAGEAGTVGAPAAFINAVIDALAPYGVTTIDMPVTPQKLWRVLRASQQDDAA